MELITGNTVFFEKNGKGLLVIVFMPFRSMVEAYIKYTLK